MDHDDRAKYASHAPNWCGPYPLASDRYGPAWRSVWRTLVEHSPRWHDEGRLVALVAERYAITPAELSWLIRDAGRADVIAYEMPWYDAGDNPPDARVRIRVLAEHAGRGWAAALLMRRV